MNPKNPDNSVCLFHCPTSWPWGPSGPKTCRGSAASLSLSNESRSNWAWLTWPLATPLDWWMEVADQTGEGGKHLSHKARSSSPRVSLICGVCFHLPWRAARNVNCMNGRWWGGGDIPLSPGDHLLDGCIVNANWKQETMNHHASITSPLYGWLRSLSVSSAEEAAPSILLPPFILRNLMRRPLKASQMYLWENHLFKKKEQTMQADRNKTPKWIAYFSHWSHHHINPHCYSEEVLWVCSPFFLICGNI